MQHEMDELRQDLLEYKDKLNFNTDLLQQTYTEMTNVNELHRKDQKRNEKYTKLNQKLKQDIAQLQEQNDQVKEQLRMAEV